MTITFESLKRRPVVDKAVVHSLDSCLYQCSVILDGVESLIVDSRGNPVRTFNQLDMQEFFRGVQVKEMVLRQQSAYDEMIGQPFRDGDNVLEVPLGHPFPDEHR